MAWPVASAGLDCSLEPAAMIAFFASAVAAAAVEQIDFAGLAVGLSAQHLAVDSGSFEHLQQAGFVVAGFVVVAKQPVVGAVDVAAVAVLVLELVAVAGLAAAAVGLAAAVELAAAAVVVVAAAAASAASGKQHSSFDSAVALCLLADLAVLVELALSPELQAVPAYFAAGKELDCFVAFVETVAAAAVAATGPAEEVGPRFVAFAIADCAAVAAAEPAEFGLSGSVAGSDFGVGLHFVLGFAAALGVVIELDGGE